MCKKYTVHFIMQLINSKINGKAFLMFDSFEHVSQSRLVTQIQYYKTNSLFKSQKENFQSYVAFEA